MKNIIELKYFIIILIAFISCSDNNQEQSCEHDWKNIIQKNDHMDYVSFIRKHPESNYFNIAIDSFFVIRERFYENNSPPIIDCFSSCGEISIDSLGDVYFEGKFVSLDTLDNFILSFIQNKDNSLNLPGKSIISDLNNKEREVSKAAFLIFFESNQKKKLQQVVIIISNSFDIFKDNLSKSWYNKSYSSLNQEVKTFLDSILDYRLGFYDIFTPTIPPPPEE